MGYSEGICSHFEFNIHTSLLRTASLINLASSFLSKIRLSIHCKAVDNVGTDRKFFFLIYVLHINFMLTQTVS